MKRRRFTQDLKRSIVEQLLSETAEPAELCRRCLKKEDERPSKRYGSIPIDGPARGRGVMQKWSVMLKNYYTLMGWDPETGNHFPKLSAHLGWWSRLKILKHVETGGHFQ